MRFYFADDELQFFFKWSNENFHLNSTYASFDKNDVFTNSFLNKSVVALKNLTRLKWKLSKLSKTVKQAGCRLLIRSSKKILLSFVALRHLILSHLVNVLFTRVLTNACVMRFFLLGLQFLSGFSTWCYWRHSQFS